MELDNIKSTITISLGTKNKLRTLKGNYTYEEFINQLLRDKNELRDSSLANRIEKTSFKRKKGILKVKDLSIIYSYNSPNKSSNFRFDTHIEKIRLEGKIVSQDQFQRNELIRLQLQIISTIIQKEIDSSFKHKGRIEDYYNWKKEFELLGLPKIAYEEDILELLEELTDE